MYEFCSHLLKGLWGNKGIDLLTRTEKGKLFRLSLPGGYVHGGEYGAMLAIFYYYFFFIHVCVHQRTCCCMCTCVRVCTGVCVPVRASVSVFALMQAY